MIRATGRYRSPGRCGMTERAVKAEMSLPSRSLIHQKRRFMRQRQHSMGPSPSTEPIWALPVDLPMRSRHGARGHHDGPVAPQAEGGHMAANVMVVVERQFDYPRP